MASAADGEPYPVAGENPEPFAGSVRRANFWESDQHPVTIGLAQEPDLALAFEIIPELSQGFRSDPDVGKALEEFTSFGREPAEAGKTGHIDDLKHIPAGSR